MQTKQFTLTEAIENLINKKLLDVNVALPGKILKYNKADQTANVEIGMKRKLSGVEIEYPTLEDVPVVFTRGLKSGFTMIPESGDGCLILFVQRNLDAWLGADTVQVPLDSRKFDINDAVVLPGLTKENRRIKDQIEGTALVGEKIYLGNPDGTPTSLRIDAVEVVRALVEALKIIGAEAIYATSTGPTSTMQAPASTDLQAIVADLEGLIP